MYIYTYIQILPSPTTGSFAAQGSNWKNNSGNNQQSVKQEEKNYSDFSFQTQKKPPASSSSMFQSSNTATQAVSDWVSNRCDRKNSVFDFVLNIR